MANRIRATRVGSLITFVTIVLGPFGVLAQVAGATAGDSIAEPSYGYTRDFARSGVGSYDEVEGNGVKTDAAGNIYVVGDFNYSATFNGSENYATRNGFVTKFSPSGAYLSTYTMGDTSNGWVSAQSITLDSSGAMYVAGTWSGTVDFGNSAQLTASSSINNPFVEKFNADGSYAWVRTFYDPNGHGVGSGVAVDSQGDVYFTGAFWGTVLFGMSDSATANSSGYGSFLTKYDSNGNYGWTKTSDVSASGSMAWSQSVTVDPAGNPTIMGDFVGTVGYDGTHMLTAPVNTEDAIIVSYDRTGVYTSSKVTEGSPLGYIVASAGAYMPDGSFYVDGSFSGTVTFGGADTFTDAGGQSDGYVSKYDANGNYLWTRAFDTTAGLMQTSSIAVDADGTVYTGSVFTGTISYPGNTSTFTDANGQIDGAVSAFTSEGAYQWTKSFDTSAGGYAQLLGITVSPSRQLYAVGGFAGTVKFGGTDVLSVPSNTIDAYLTNFTVPGIVPAITTPSVITTPITSTPTTAASSKVSTPRVLTPLHNTPTTMATSEATSTTATNIADSTATSASQTSSASDTSTETTASKSASDTTQKKSHVNAPIVAGGSILGLVILILLVRFFIKLATRV